MAAGRSMPSRISAAVPRALGGASAPPPTAADEEKGLTPGHAALYASFEAECPPLPNKVLSAGWVLDMEALGAYCVPEGVAAGTAGRWAYARTDDPSETALYHAVTERLKHCAVAVHGHPAHDDVEALEAHLLRQEALFPAGAMHAVIGLYLRARRHGGTPLGRTYDMQCFMMLVAFLERTLIEVVVLGSAGGGAGVGRAKVKMKDMKITEVLQAPALRDAVGAGTVWMLRALIGPLHGLFLRNLAWHNFVGSADWEPKYTSLLLCFAASLPLSGCRVAMRGRSLPLLTALETLRRPPHLRAALREEARQDVLRFAALSGAPAPPPRPAFVPARGVQGTPCGVWSEDAPTSSYIDPALPWCPAWVIQERRVWAHKGGALFDVAAWAAYLQRSYAIELCSVPAPAPGAFAGVDGLIDASVFFLASRKVEWKAAFAAAARGEYYTACSLATVLLESALRRLYVAANAIDAKWVAPERDELFAVIDYILDPWMTWAPAPCGDDAGTAAPAPEVVKWRRGAKAVDSPGAVAAPEIEAAAVAARQPDVVIADDEGTCPSRARNRLFDVLPHGVQHVLYDHWIWKGGVNVRDGMAHAGVAVAGVGWEVTGPVLAAAVHLGLMCCDEGVRARVRGDLGGDAAALDAWVIGCVPQLSPFALFAAELRLYLTEAQPLLATMCARIRERGTGFPPPPGTSRGDGASHAAATAAAGNARRPDDPNTLPRDARQLAAALLSAVPKEGLEGIVEEVWENVGGDVRCAVNLCVEHPLLRQFAYEGKPSNMLGRCFAKVHMLRRILAACHQFALKLASRYDESYALVAARKAYKQQRIAYARLLEDAGVLWDMVHLAVVFAQVNYVYRLPHDEALREACLNYMHALVAQTDRKQWAGALPEYRAFAALLAAVGDAPTLAKH